MNIEGLSLELNLNKTQVLHLAADRGDLCAGAMFPVFPCQILGFAVVWLFLTLWFIFIPPTE